MTNFLERLQLDTKKIVLVTFAFAVILFLDFTFVIKMQLDGIKAKEPKITKLRKDLDILSEELFRMQGLKNKQVAANRQLQSQAKIIISPEEMPSLLENISGLAKKNNVKIMQLKPVKETTQKKSAITEKFTAFSVNLDASCDYHSLGRFINGLENAQVFLAVQSLKIKSAKENSLEQSVNLVLGTYVKK